MTNISCRLNIRQAVQAKGVSSRRVPRLGRSARRAVHARRVCAVCVVERSCPQMRPACCRRMRRVADPSRGSSSPAAATSCGAGRPAGGYGLGGTRGAGVTASGRLRCLPTAKQSNCFESGPGGGPSDARKWAAASGAAWSGTECRAGGGSTGGKLATGPQPSSRPCRSASRRLGEKNA
jgi:hypothetical protein